MPTASTSSPTHGQQTIVLGEWGPDVTGRTLGKHVRGNVEPWATEITFDCTDVEAMSPSFADEVFGKLAEAAHDGRTFRVVNANPEVLDTIRFAVRQRTAA